MARGIMIEKPEGGISARPSTPIVRNISFADGLNDFFEGTNDENLTVNRFSCSY